MPTYDFDPPPGRFKRWVAAHVTVLSVVSILIGIGLIAMAISNYQETERWWAPLLTAIAYFTFPFIVRGARTEVRDYDARPDTPPGNSGGPAPR